MGWTSRPRKDVCPSILFLLLAKHGGRDRSLGENLWDLSIRQAKKAGLLQPLYIAKKPWVFVSMDFISSFPKVNKLSSVLVVVDWFLKYTIFITTPHTCIAEQITELFFRNVVKYFKLLEEIISDHDTRFIGRFWTSLFRMLGSELRFSIANHPQKDG